MHDAPYRLVSFWPSVPLPETLVLVPIPSTSRVQDTGHGTLPSRQTQQDIPWINTSVPALTGTCSHPAIFPQSSSLGVTPGTSVNSVPPFAERTNRECTRAVLCEPGRKDCVCQPELHGRTARREFEDVEVVKRRWRLTRHPFEVVQSSKAIQQPIADGGSVYRNVESLCIGTSVVNTQPSLHPPPAWPLTHSRRQPLDTRTLTLAANARLLADDHTLQYPRALHLPQLLCQIAHPIIFERIPLEDWVEHGEGVPYLVDRTRGRHEELGGCRGCCGGQGGRF
jgi:hypothetical protein